MGVPIGMGALNGIGGLMNKTHLKGGSYSKGSAYWKEGAKSNHYGTYHVRCDSSSCYRHVQNLVVTIETSTFDCFLLCYLPSITIMIELLIYLDMLA